MTIFFDATRRVKTTRRFGEGILRSLPIYRAPYTTADEAWLIEDNARRDAENRRLDRMADKAAAERRYEAGYVV